MHCLPAFHNRETEVSEEIYKEFGYEALEVTEDVFEAAKASLQKKKPNLDISKAQLKKITEGLCVQVMHIGSYDDEPKTIVVLDGFARQNGYVLDINKNRLHHEIYISDPRKVASDRLKTVLRHPIRKD